MAGKPDFSPQDRILPAPQVLQNPNVISIRSGMKKPVEPQESGEQLRSRLEKKEKPKPKTPKTNPSFSCKIRRRRKSRKELRNSGALKRAGRKRQVRRKDRMLVCSRGADGCQPIRLRPQTKKKDSADSMKPNRSRGTKNFPNPGSSFLH